MSIDLAVIGGSGLYNFPGLENAQRQSVDTPFGPASGDVVTGDFAGKRLAFLARHGESHSLPPHRVNYRANLWALHHLGALARDDVRLAHLAEFALQRSGETLTQLREAVFHRSRGAEELGRILDAPARDGVHVQALLVIGDDLGSIEIEAHVALVVIDHVLDEWRLEVQAGLALRTVRVDGVTHSAQPASDDLFAKQLRTEGPDTENVRDSVGIPALGQHRDRNDATYVFAQFSRLADSVHDLAQEVLIVQIISATTWESGSIVCFELFDFDRGDFLEFGRQPFT